MRLYGRLRDTELIRDLLVEQSLGEHHQDAYLLRRERGKARQQIGSSAVGPGTKIDVGGRPDSPFEHARDGSAHVVNAECLGYEAGGAEIHAAADDGRVIVGGNDDDRNAWILSAQGNETGKYPHPGHRKVEQNKIALQA